MRSNDHPIANEASLKYSTVFLDGHTCADDATLDNTIWADDRAVEDVRVVYYRSGADNAIPPYDRGVDLRIFQNLG